MKKNQKELNGAEMNISNLALFQPEYINQTVFSEDGIELVHLWSCGEGIEICKDDEENVFHVWLPENHKNSSHGVVTFASSDGKLLTKHTFDDCDDFHDGLLCVYTEGKGYGYIDRNGKLAIPPQYEETQDFHNNYAAVKKDGQWLLIDREGKELALQRSYRQFGIMENGRCPASTVHFESDDFAYHSNYACDAGWWGYVAENGKEVIPPQYIYATDFKNGLAVVCKGKWTKSPKWDNEHRKGKYWFEEARWGVIDPDGNEVIPCQYDKIETFSATESQDIFKVHTGGWEHGRWGVMDKQGRWIAPPVFDELGYDYQDGYFIFFPDLDIEKKENTAANNTALYRMQGVFEVKTQTVLFEFPEIEILQNGLFLVTKITANGKITQHILDRTGKEMFSSDYRTIHYTTTPYKVCKDNGSEKLWGFIDPDGTVILPCEYHFPLSLAFWEYSSTIFMKDGKFGAVGADGRILLPAKYHQLDHLIEQWFRFETEMGRMGIVSASGKIILSEKKEYVTINWDFHNHIIAVHDHGTDIFEIRKTARMQK